ncbi:flavin monoamine oxidase family protein [Pseudoalteromonas luteoviolacea]|uniref:flavin monoamine oxidase family protein n=1 Tax=Pseudoalteromonas luteoviolacea TaxID=43657 RepID=UPI001B3643B5|nr:FAD-dependent oxidoreductase [Pseudoalteromonas luteoviolacea]MBQ4838539.1 FAD-dependent oxidoreductase [Pseudoalteromonas luteoviolacea]
MKNNTLAHSGKPMTLLNSVRALTANSLKGAPSVTIIGAGIAGLTSAYELVRLGAKVTILEADPGHIGGRVRTLRESDTLYAELGAMRIPTHHQVTRKYIAEMGLNLRPFVQDNVRTHAMIRGKKVARSPEGFELLKSAFELTAKERSMSADNMWDLAVTEVLNSLSDNEKQALYEKKLTTKKLKELDAMSLKDAFKQAGLSSEALEYVSSIYGVSTLLHTAFSEHLREQLERVWFEGFDEVVGGTDLLAKHLHQRIAGQVDFLAGAKAVEVKNLTDKVSICYQLRDRSKHTIESDYAICTLPFGVLGKIDFHNSINPKKARAFAQVHYDSATKVLIRTKNRFWELKEKIYGGSTIYDAGLGHTWYPADNAVAKDKAISNAASYLLASYTWGQHARRVDTLNNFELKELLFTELKKVHPYIERDDILSVLRWSWSNHTHSAGAYAFFNPRDHQDYYALMSEPEHRLCFAGEHCSVYHSWIQGALVSALEAVQYIHKQA